MGGNAGCDEVISRQTKEVSGFKSCVLCSHQQHCGGSYVFVCVCSGFTPAAYASSLHSFVWNICILV